MRERAEVQLRLEPERQTESVLDFKCQRTPAEDNLDKQSATTTISTANHSLNFLASIDRICAIFLNQSTLILTPSRRAIQDTNYPRPLSPTAQLFRVNKYQRRLRRSLPIHPTIASKIARRTIFQKTEKDINIDLE